MNYLGLRFENDLQNDLEGVSLTLEYSFSNFYHGEFQSFYSSSMETTHTVSGSERRDRNLIVPLLK